VHEKCTTASIGPWHEARFRRHSGYAVRVDLGPDPTDGKRRQHYEAGFRTKREAAAALDELRLSVRSGDVVNQTGQRHAPPCLSNARVNTVSWRAHGPQPPSAHTRRI
jgi:hypothetical protein